MRAWVRVWVRVWVWVRLRLPATGLVRGWDLTVSPPSSSVRITVDSLSKGKDTPVWSLAVLSDFTLITGDAVGHVQLWDGRMGTLLHSFTEHRADVMSIAVHGSDMSAVGRKGAREGVSFVTASVDGKVVVYKAVPSGVPGAAVRACAPGVSVPSCLSPPPPPFPLHYACP